jgi:hypothetical protein
LKTEEVPIQLRRELEHESQMKLESEELWVERVREQDQVLELWE